MTISRRGGRGLPAWLSCLVVITLAVLGATPALGQGTSGALADPISTNELEAYARRYLGLTDQQLVQLAPVHDQYKADFKVLRDGEIESFMKMTRDTQAAGMPSREQVDELMDTLGKVMGKIKTLDNRLFDGMGPFLTEEQQVNLQRVRRARERRIYATEMTMIFSQGRYVDLSELVYDENLDAEQRAAVDPILINYETKLTKLHRDLFEATTGMFKRLFDELDAAGFRGQDLSDIQGNPEEAQRMFEVMRLAWEKVYTESAEISAKQMKLHASTLGKLTVALSVDTADEVRDAYIGKAYPEIGWGWMPPARLEFRQVLASPVLPSDRREDVVVARDTWAFADLAIVKKMTDSIDDARRNQSIFDFGGGDWEERQAQLNEWRESRKALSERAVQDLHELLGEQLLARVKDPGAARQDLIEGFGAMIGEEEAARIAGEMHPAVRPSGAGGAAPDVRSLTSMPSGEGYGVDTFVAGPISIQQVGQLKNRFGLDEDARDILDALHSAYNERYQSTVSPRVKALHEAQQSQWQVDEEGHMFLADENAPERTFEARVAAIEATREVDREFLDNVILALGFDEDRTRLLRLWRDAEVLGRGINFNAWGVMPSSESAVNIVSLVSALKIEDTDRLAADCVMLNFAQTLTESLRSSHEVAVVSQRMMDAYTARMQALQRQGVEGEDMSAIAMESQRAFEDINSAGADAGEQLRTLNRSMRDAMLEAMSDDGAAIFRLEYNRRAFPSIYSDPKSAESSLERAPAMGDLTEAQREELEAVATTFRGDYAELCEKMVAVSAASGGAWPLDAEGWQAYQKRENDLDRIRFERDEVSGRAYQHIRAILTEEQTKRIPALTAPQSTDTARTMQIGAG